VPDIIHQHCPIHLIHLIHMCAKSEVPLTRAKSYLGNLEKGGAQTDQRITGATPFAIQCGKRIRNQAEGFSSTSGLAPAGGSMSKRDLPGWYQAEVDWLYNCADGEHGRRAVPLEPSLGGNPDTMDDMRCAAATRARRVLAALETLTPADWRLLFEAHEYVGPGAHVRHHRAQREARERVSDLMVASTAFRRAWLALGAVRRAA